MTLNEAIVWCKRFITSMDKVAWWKRVQKNQEWRFYFYSPENQKSYDSIEQLEKIFRDKQHPVSDALIAVWRTEGKEEVKLDLDHLNADGSPIYNVGAYGPESKTPWAEPHYLVTVHINYVTSDAQKSKESMHE